MVVESPCAPSCSIFILLNHKTALIRLLITQRYYNTNIKL